jgi:hypothetical protein
MPAYYSLFAFDRVFSIFSIASLVKVTVELSNTEAFVEYDIDNHYFNLK